MQTLVGVVNASVNLDYYGIGDDPCWRTIPLRYNLEALGATARAKYRLGDSRLWAGELCPVTTKVSFDTRRERPGSPSLTAPRRLGGFTPADLRYAQQFLYPDTRHVSGSFAGASSTRPSVPDNEFQRVSTVAMKYFN